MSVSFTWQIQRNDRKPVFKRGTSNDVSVLRDTFPDCVVSTKDISTLRAMHRATGHDFSLWGDIADKLDSLQGEDYDREIKLEIGMEY